MTMTMTDTTSVNHMPTSFGVFKPTGWLMIGLPTQAQATALASTLHEHGCPPSDLLAFVPSETLPELQAMVDEAGSMAGFGYELTLLRRYVKLTLAGHRWLLVKVDGTDEAAAVAEQARAAGATMAVHYRLLTVEDLI